MTHIYYEARYNDADAPKIFKIIDIDGDPSTEISTSITLQNSEELDHISNEIIWAHIENLIKYMSSRVEKISITDLAIFPVDGWPVVGWSDLEKLNTEINSWWYFLVRRDTEPHTHN